MMQGDKLNLLQVYLYMLMLIKANSIEKNMYPMIANPITANTFKTIDFMGLFL